jgi:transcription initiation factor TFIIH subunit 4
MGITASQIHDFLCSHAHPQVRHRKSIVPDNVYDQLKLWEAENFRVQDEEAVLIELASIRGVDKVMFAEIFKYAKTLGVCLWVSDAKMALAVTETGAETVLSYISDRMNPR